MIRKIVTSVLLTSMCVMVPITGYGQVPAQGMTEVIEDSVINEENLTVADAESDICAPCGYTQDMEEAGCVSGEDQVCVERYDAQVSEKDSKAQDASHKAGKKAYWEYDSDTMTITISGTGDMYDYYDMPGAFYDSGANWAEKLVVEEGITSIGVQVFAEFHELRNIELPDSLKKIEYAAFANCYGLTEIKIPSGVTFIGQNAFQEASFQEFTIPAGMTSFIPEALYNSTCQDIYVEEGNTAYCSVDGVLFSANKKTLVCFPSGRTGTYKVPNSVKTLGECAFIRTNLDSVDMNKVETLKDFVFAYSQLTSVTIPDSLHTIGDCEWEGSYELKEVTFGTGLNALGYRTFSECSSLNKIDWGKNLTDLDMLSFAGCTSLKSVSIPSGVEFIKNGSFGDCTALEKVILPSSVKEIWFQAFLNDTKLKGIQLPKGLKVINRQSFLNTGITEITLPESVTYVGDEAFTEGTMINKSNRLTKMEDGSYKVVAKVKLSSVQYYTDAYKILKLVNEKRTAKGLSKVSMDKDLLAAAMKRAAECSLFYSHTRPSGLDCFTASGKMTRENIAVGQLSPAEVMTDWMNSSGHKANIMADDVKSIGIGCAKVDGVYYWVQCFGTNAADKADSSDYIDKKVTKTLRLDPNAEDDFGEKMSFQASISEKKLKVDETAKISVKVYNGFCYTKIPSKNLQYKTSVSDVVSVQEGKITGKKAGKTTITTYLDGYPELTFKHKVQVMCPATTITGISKTSSGLKLSWKKVNGAVKYEVYKKGSDGYTKVKTTTKLSWTDKNVKKGKKYTYKVKTVGEEVSGSYSKAKSITK